MMECVSRIAIFRALYLGDMLCIIPSVRAIRKAFPVAEITLIGLPWQKDLVLRFPHYFDHFMEFPGWPGLPEQPANPARILRFLHAVQQKEFDIVFQMHGNGTITNSMCMLWGAKKLCGLRRGGGYAPDPDCFPVSEDGEHEVLRFMKLLDSMGIPRQGTDLEFPVLDREVARFQEIAAEAGLAPKRYVCLHPGARDVRRRWPVEKFAALAGAIAAGGYVIVLTGSQEEKQLLRRLEQQIAQPVVNIVERFGQLSVGELAAVIRETALLVSNDTGVSHLAAAMRVESIVLFSPHSDLQRWHPLNRERHRAIPFEKTADPAYVAQCVLDRFSQQPSGQASRPVYSGRITE